MNDGILSQEEIDALLKGQTQADAGGITEEIYMTEMEEDALGEVGNISMGTSATALSTLLGKKVSITTPRIKYTSVDMLKSDYPVPYVVVEVKYREGIRGSNILIIKKEDASIIADLMMGGAGVPDELNELSLSAVGEAMNQMMGSATTSLSSMFNKKIDIAPPKISIVDFSSVDGKFEFGNEFDSLVQISFRMEIGDLVDSEIMQLMPIDSAHAVVDLLMVGMNNSVREAPPVPPSHKVKEPEPLQIKMPVGFGDPADLWAPGPSAPVSVAPPPVAEPVAVRPVHFADLGDPSVQSEVRNIDIILDVPLDISVELGKTKKSIKEILELGPGSIIQLDKLAGEPVDLMVNGKLIAKGEVVVIDENYGLRISAIVSPLDRMTKLQ